MCWFLGFFVFQLEMIVKATSGPDQFLVLGFSINALRLKPSNSAPFSVIKVLPFRLQKSLIVGYISTKLTGCCTTFPAVFLKLGCLIINGTRVDSSHNEYLNR